MFDDLIFAPSKRSSVASRAQPTNKHLDKQTLLTSFLDTVRLDSFVNKP